jgi:hypothetical protein
MISGSTYAILFFGLTLGIVQQLDFSERVLSTRTTTRHFLSPSYKDPHRIWQTSNHFLAFFLAGFSSLFFFEELAFLDLDAGVAFFNLLLEFEPDRPFAGLTTRVPFLSNFCFFSRTFFASATSSKPCSIILRKRSDFQSAAKNTE